MNIISGIANVFCGVLFVCISIPLLKDMIPMNRFYGFRFAKSFESERNWYQINKYGAKRMILWSVPIILIGIITFFIPFSSKSLGTLLALVPLLVIIPAMESYFYAKKL
ncbi:SdpI family protein [Desulfonema magnum]|uniref:SdpI/YhfL protein family domain-containing protein n=1 Tax=Desulfonema magnum TaxID=45655 RepID=A0A975BS50_9BACT|nr:SdpI family protein [Desulfonema magnum]QTA90829.1 SdpI/YhfL protein family domain-containing protein [Desulfonema magnum]